MTKKAILACVAWTRTDGAIPSRAPSAKPQEIPNQSLIFMTSVYHYWLHSGDRETAAAYCTAFLNYLKMVEMENGLPVYRDGSWTWNDWGDCIDTRLLQAGIYYYALTVTKSIADDLGITEGTEFLTERMDSMKENWRAATTPRRASRARTASMWTTAPTPCWPCPVWPGRRTTPSSPMWS